MWHGSTESENKNKTNWNTNVYSSRQCPNGDGIYTLLYALYKYSTSITNQPTNVYSIE